MHQFFLVILINKKWKVNWHILSSFGLRSYWKYEPFLGGRNQYGQSLLHWANSFHSKTYIRANIEIKSKNFKRKMYQFFYKLLVRKPFWMEPFQQIISILN